MTFSFSMRVPTFIQTTLKEFFDNKNLKFDINADEAVAYGATLLAAQLSNSADTSVRNIKLLDVTPHSLGTDSYLNKTDKNGYFDVVVKRNTKIPFEETAYRTTLYANQDEMDFVVYEGEDEKLLENNKKLGTFTLKNIAPGRSGIPQIEVIFKIDDNGILTVSAIDKRSGSSSSLDILPNKGRLSEFKIAEMINEISPPSIDIDSDDD